MRKQVLETERLLLCEFLLTDAQLLIDLNSDEEVTRYTGDGPVQDLAEAERILSEIIFPQYKNQLGRWAVFLKDDNQFIGWCGLKYLADENEVDLGYRYFKRFWNKGYATEAAKAVMEYGLQTKQLNCIVGRAAKENTASIRVLKKVGMDYLMDEADAHHPAEKYILKK